MKVLVIPADAAMACVELDLGSGPPRAEDIDLIRALLDLGSPPRPALIPALLDEIEDDGLRLTPLGAPHARREGPPDPARLAATLRASVAPRSIRPLSASGPDSAG